MEAELELSEASETPAAQEEAEEEEMEAPAVDMFGGDDGGDY